MVFHDFPPDPIKNDLKNMKKIKFWAIGSCFKCLLSKNHQRILPATLWIRMHTFLSFWTQIGQFWWYFWQKFVPLDEFSQFSSTLGSCISMTTHPLTKNLGIFSVYFLRSDDCAMFRCRIAKTKFLILMMEICISEILTPCLTEILQTKSVQNRWWFCLQLDISMAKSRNWPRFSFGNQFRC